MTAPRSASLGQIPPHEVGTSTSCRLNVMPRGDPQLGARSILQEQRATYTLITMQEVSIWPAKIIPTVSGQSKAIAA